jgi:signal transduction histidine kinase
VQLQQVMMNLILNAIEAMKSVTWRRELVIESQRAAHETVTICVSDTGMGLPSGQSDRIFDAFFTTKPQGTGIGLSVSRSIIEAHNGRLWADGNAPHGARFHILLQSPEIAAATGRVAERQSDRGIRP